MPTDHVITIKKYRVTVEELRTVEHRPTYEEQNPKAVPESWQKPETYRDDEWYVTDRVELTDNNVVAGFLEAKARYFNPPTEATRGVQY